jgi:NCAIR mutase (PurE)-related protein
VKALLAGLDTAATADVRIAGVHRLVSIVRAEVDGRVDLMRSVLLAIIFSLTGVATNFVAGMENMTASAFGIALFLLLSGLVGSAWARVTGRAGRTVHDR